MKRIKPGDWVYPLIIGLLAIIPRIWNVLATGSEYYANFLSDASTYRFWAAQIIAGAGYGEPVFVMGPLYPYFLALNLGLGFNFNGVLFIQAFLGAFTCILIYYITRIIYGNLAGFISGIIAAFYGPFIFYNGLLLSETIQILLLAIAILLLVSRFRKSSRLPVFIAGVLIGLTSLAQGTVAIFAILLAGFWLIRYYRHSKRESSRYGNWAILLFAGTIAGILPATIHNLANGDFVPISSNMGINFYVGNNAGSTGAYDAPPGLNLATDFSGRKVAEKQMHRQLKSSEVSSFWMARAFADIKAAPFDFLGRMAKKIWLYFWYFDIPQAESLQTQRLFSPIFKLPLPGFGLILLLGALSIALCKIDERTWIILLALIANLIGITLFFVIGRFRLVGALSLLILSGPGLLALVENIKKHNYHQLIIVSCVIFILTIVLFLPRPINRREKLASAYNNIGIYYYYNGELDKALNWYRQAAVIMPTFPGALNNIGTYFYLKGQADSAMSYFEKSWNIDTTETETAMNLGRLAEDKGDYPKAIDYYEKAKLLAPFGNDAESAIDRVHKMQKGNAAAVPEESFGALFELAERLAGRYLFAEAQINYERALRLRPNDIRTLNNLGYAYQAQEKYSQAAQCFSDVLKQSPNNAIAYNNLAGTVYQIGMADSAKTLWQKALKFDPGNAQIKKNLDFVKNLKGQ
jgi:tetratricopeptide (TPR) repeat protein